MKQSYRTELLHVLWSLYPEKSYTSTDGRNITVLSHGEYDEKRERFCGAKVRIDDNIHHGDITIWAGDELPQGDFESTVLHVSPGGSASILKNNGEPVPQVLDDPDPVCCLAYESLKAGMHRAGCSGYVASMEPHERVALFTRLMADRLYRKYSEVMAVFEECEQNWNETLYVMLLRAMGGSYNKNAFTELARKVHYKDICWVKGAVQNAEALLLGTSGLLDSFSEDQYIRDLKDTFHHYCRRNNIVPMRAGQWTFNTHHANGSPVLRLAQLAAFFSRRSLLVDPVVNCRTVEEIHRLFDVEASVYWSTHYKPGETGAYRLKKLGHSKANSLGINFVVPMQFAYAVHTGNESLKEAALELLEKINPEEIKRIDEWRKAGTLTENAFDSQALLQLNNEFCFKGLCWQCTVGKRVVKGAYKQVSAQKM